MKRQSRAMAAFAACALLLHIGALWALHTGMLSRTLVVAQSRPLQARMLEPQSGAVATPPSAPSPSTAKTAPKPPAPEPRATVQRPAPARAASPATHDPGPAPSPPAPKPALVPAPVAPPERPPAPTVGRPLTASPAPPAAASGPAAMPAIGTGVGTAEGVAADSGKNKAAIPEGNGGVLAASPVGAAKLAVPATPQPPTVELPSSDAKYLRNPRPRYPPISLRLREQGTVLVDVLVSDQGLAQDARIRTSSGFFRLDNAALSSVLTWRFVPGKRAGVAQSMWFTVPVTFDIQ